MLQPKSGSWTSQRALEAQVATLRQQLDIAAATQMELQKEIDVRCAPFLLCYKTVMELLTALYVLSDGSPTALPARLSCKHLWPDSCPHDAVE